QCLVRPSAASAASCRQRRHPSAEPGCAGPEPKVARGVSYELVTYGAKQREDYLRLLRGAWGEGAMTGDEFDWWFDGNPSGSLRSVAVLDGHVVGVAGHSLYAMVLDGELHTASFSVHAVTHPSARGRGIFVELERKHEH